MTEPNGFYYMRARYYDPEVGRFISEDPLGFDGGDVNLYVYVGNNPVLLIDPLGLYCNNPNACPRLMINEGQLTSRISGPMGPMGVDEEAAEKIGEAYKYVFKKSLEILGTLPGKFYVDLEEVNKLNKKFFY